MAQAAEGFAQRLATAGIAPGERVILWGENRPEWIAAFWGCLLHGAVVTPVDYRSSPDLLARIADLVQARAIVAGELVPQLPGHWKMAELEWPSSGMSSGERSVFRTAQAAELCEILFTSGATADPKGVTITQANLLANIVPVETEIRKYRKWSIPFAPIRFLNLLPLSHLFGQSMATFIPPVLPGEVVFMTGFAPREIVRQIHARRISVLVSVPKILEVLRDFVMRQVPEAGEPARPGANWVRRWWQYRRVHNLFGWKFWSFIVGAAPLEPELEEFWSKLGFVVIQGYGLTETAPIVTLNHPFYTSKGSVGKPIGGVEVKIADDGEILVRGANVSSGYYGADESLFTDGWFHTGDVGGRDADGGVFIRGRKKEMIVTPEGMNVFPEDVERVLNGVAGVAESAVVGTDRVRAVVVLEPGASLASVVEQANGKLEPHQQIREATVWPGDRLPRTEGTRKLKRVAIRDYMEGVAAAPVNSSDTAEELLSGWAEETPLAQLGLSSLDRVELLVRSERSGAAAMDEAAFTQAKTVGELRQLARSAGAEPSGAIGFPTWNQSWWARLLRRVALPAVLLPLLRIFVWLRVTGLQNLPEDTREPVLFAVNHQSVFDVPAVLAAMPGAWRYYVATAMGMDWFRPFFHPEAYGWGERFGNALQYYLVCLCFNAFPIPQHEAGARETLRYAGELVSQGKSVLLFPEGVRTRTGEIGEFRAGIGMMAAKLRVRVVPVKIEGLDRVLPQGAKWPRPGRVSVTFGPPMQLAGGDSAALAKQLEDAVRELGSQAGGVKVTAMFWTALLCIWTASEIGINIATRTRRGQGIIEDRGSLLVLWIVIVSSVTACEVFRRTAVGAEGNSRLLATLGWVVLLLGLAIRWAAIFSLGKSFSANVAIQPTQTVYRGGLYSSIRHPSYLGLLLIFEGIGLHACNWIALLVAFIPPTAAVLYRIRVEEAALEKAFGEEYLAYERDTKRLIPGVY